MTARLGDGDAIHPGDERRSGKRLRLSSPGWIARFISSVFLKICIGSGIVRFISLTCERRAKKNRSFFEKKIVLGRARGREEERVKIFLKGVDSIREKNMH